jgi:hypothetical protein
MSLILNLLPKSIRRLSAVVVAALLLGLTSISCTHSYYHDEMFYEDVAWGLVTGLDDIYDDYIAGTPTGCLDILACGPYGGIVHITGTTSYDPWTGIETAYLRYDMSDVRISCTSSSSDLGVDLRLNGSICEQSSWSHDYSCLRYDSPGLWLAGSAQRGCEQRGVDGMTDFWANSTSSGTSAELFGYNVSW